MTSEYEIKRWEGYFLSISDSEIKVYSSWGFNKGKPLKGSSGPQVIIEGKRRELTQRINAYGYVMVDLCGRSLQLHRLIAETLIENPNNLECVDHIDGNKLNNNPSNLQWITRGDNVRKSQSMGKWGNPPQTYKIIFESGKIEIITNISDFSRKNNYEATKLVAVSKGRRNRHKDVVNVIKLEELKNGKTTESKRRTN
jgi:hypothetical protein